MKKLASAIALLFAVVVLSSSLVTAQPMERSVGVKGGLNVSNFSGGDAGDDEWRYAGVFGGFLCFHVNEFLAIQPEVLIAMKGSRADVLFDVDGNLVLGRETVKLTYLEFPVAAKVYFPGQVVLKPYVYAGLAFSVKVGSRLKSEFGSTDIEEDFEHVRGADLGMIVGAGFDYELGPGSALLDIRYDVGFVSVDSSVRDLDERNSTFSFVIGYGLPF